MKKNLTEREFEIMEALWKSDRPLHAAELMERTSSISANSIHRIIGNLLSRGYIKIVGTVQISRSTSRLYSPLISAEEYTWEQMNKIFKTDGSKSPVFSLLKYLAKKDKKKTDELKQELLDIINDMD